MENIQLKAEQCDHMHKTRKPGYGINSEDGTKSSAYRLAFRNNQLPTQLSRCKMILKIRKMKNPLPSGVSLT